MKCKHKLHESKESLVKEAFEHEPKLHKVPKASISLKKLKGGKY